MENYALADVIIKGMATAGAGLFFFYKISAGFNNQNLSLSIDCMRFQEAGGEGVDLVVARIGVEKGTIAALKLEGLEAQFKWGESENQIRQVPVDIQRKKVQHTFNPKVPQVLWEEESHQPHLYLSPGEKTVFSCSSKVPRDAHCQIEVIAFGRRKRSTILAQWRGSSISPAGYYVKSVEST